MQRRTLIATSIASATGAMMSDATTNEAEAQANAENTLYLDLKDGRVTIELRPDLAPKHVERIKTLSAQGFYDNTPFHRVIEGFMAQGGDPTGTGTGGSQLPNVPAEFSPPAKARFLRGTCGMARAGDPNSANSQFFIMFGPRLGFDHDYTVFGRVTDGMQWVDKIERGEPPARPTRILRAFIASDNPPPYQSAPVNAPAALPAGEQKATLPQ